MQAAAYWIELRRGAAVRWPLLAYVALLGAVLLYQVHWMWFEIEFGGATAIRASSQVGRNYFFHLAWLPLAAILLYLPAIAAGTIVSERRKQTLETLLASPITPAQVVLSKFLGVALRGLAFVVAAVPLAAIAMTLGGVQPAAVAAICLVNVAAVIGCCGAGIVVSAFSLRPSPAVARAYGLAAVVPLAVPLLLASLVPGAAGVMARLGPVGDFLREASPLYVAGLLLSDAFGADYAAMLRAAIVSLGVQTAFAAVALAIAVARLKREESGVPYRRQAKFAHRTSPLGEGNPVFWREGLAAARGSGAARWRSVPVFALCVASVGLFAAQWPGNAYEICTVCVVVLGCLALLATGLRAATLVAGEKERSSWDAVLASDLTPTEIVTGKLIGNLYYFRWAAAMLLAIGLLPMMEGGDRVGYALLGALSFSGAFAVLAFAATMLGLAVSFRAASAMKAMIVTAAIGIAVNLGWAFVCLPILDHGGDSLIMLAPCAPLVFAAAYLAPLESTEGAIISIAFSGVVLYGLASLAFWQQLVAGFEGVTGRGEGSFRPSQSPLGGAATASSE